MKKIFFSCILVLTTCHIFGQENTISNFYTQNKFSFNHARAGDKGHLAAFADSRSQWVGLSGAPKAIEFGIHSPISKNTRLGFSVYNDKRGPFSATFTDLSYAYKVNFSEVQHITFGVTAGFLYRKFSIASIETGTMSDPVLINNAYNKTSYRTSVGITYVLDKLELDVVAPHLFEDGDYNKQITALASYKFDLTDKVWSIRPSILYQNFAVTPNQLDVNVLVFYKEMLWVQTGFRSNKSLLYSIGYRSPGGLELAYSYGMDTGLLRTMSGGVHEVMIAALLFPSIKQVSFGKN
jgi:type IX secretion system PorP/SprF family membrane protein